MYAYTRFCPTQLDRDGGATLPIARAFMARRTSPDGGANSSVLSALRAAWSIYCSICWDAPRRCSAAARVRLMSIELQDRDRELVEVLTHRVRALSSAQVERTWWGSAQGRRLARRRIADLETVGLLERFDSMAHPSPPLDEPKVHWEPGDSKPDLRSLAQSLRSRWSRPLEPVSVVLASRLAAERFGGFGGRRPRPSELSHDLALGDLYLGIRARDPERARRWISEAALAQAGWGREGLVLPDAFLGSAADGDELVIELLGLYPHEKLEHFHDFCLGRGLAYELW